MDIRKLLVKKASLVYNYSYRFVGTFSNETRDEAGLTLVGVMLLDLKVALPENALRYKTSKLTKNFHH